MNQQGFLEEQALKLLQEAAPGRDVGYGKPGKTGHRAARARFLGSRIVKYAYLRPSPGGTLTFAAHPGDTLDQARQLYASPTTVSSILSLQRSGWAVRPNFHFGYMTKGLCWSTTGLSVEEYATYWTERIEVTRVIRRPDWDVELDRLVEARILAEGDLECFDQQFRNTKRDMATPRPGMSVERSWSQSASLGGSLADEVRNALRQIEEICTPSDSPPLLRLQVWTDGSHTGYGAVIKDEEGRSIREFAAVAPPEARDQSDTEYLAVLWALREANELGAAAVEVHSDSRFLVDQLNQRAGVKAEGMKKHYQEVARVAAAMKVTFQWIEGETNSEADELSRRLGH